MHLHLSHHTSDITLTLTMHSKSVYYIHILSLFGQEELLFYKTVMMLYLIIQLPLDVLIS